MHFPANFYTHLVEHNYVQIKGGENRETFLEIWMVNVEQRIFARSWGLSERSWFTAFVASGIGQLKYGDTVINVRGKKLPSDAVIQKQINNAYRSRYTEKENIYYANAISQPKYAEFTMEFFYKDE